MEEKNSMKTIQYWRILYSVIYFCLYILLGIILIVLFKLGVNIKYVYIIFSLFLILVINYVLDIFLFIPFRYRNFSFFINKRYIKIVDGRFFKKKVTIPMNKIYYINVKNGPLKNKFKIRKIQIGTLANEYEIPCLDLKKVNNIKNRIILYSEKNENK